MADYVNNKELYEQFKVYHPLAKAALSAGEERPEIPLKIAEAIIQISTRIMNSYNFCNYSYKAEMISDAILQCFRKVHLFDPDRTENPFAYFSQLAWNAAVSRIKEEQKHASIRARLINDKLTTEYVENLEKDSEATNAFVDFLKDNEIFVDYFEQRKTQQQTGLIHPSLKHRNFTPYVKKENKVIESDETNLFDLTNE